MDILEKIDKSLNEEVNIEAVYADYIDELMSWVGDDAGMNEKLIASVLWAIGMTNNSMTLKQIIRDVQRHAEPEDKRTAKPWRGL